MGINAPRVEENSSSIFETVFTDAGGENIFAVGFGEEATVRLIEQLSEVEEPPTVRLLTSEAVLKWVRKDFIVASTAVELIANDTLSLRILSDHSGAQLLITEEQVLSIVHAGPLTACSAIDDAEFVTAAREQYTDVWEDAEEFSLRTPPHSRVFETLTEEISPDVEADFQSILDSLGSTHSDEFDEVAAALLAAAKHGIQLFEISRWGEDVGLASKATFSRKKNQLEDAGLVDAEKVPIEVGRPRLRLVLDSEQFSESDMTPDTIVSVGQQRFSAQA